MNCRHPFALGGERNLPDSLEMRLECFLIQTGLACRDNERPFGRVALHGPAELTLLQRGVVDKDCRRERTRDLDS